MPTWIDFKELRSKLNVEAVLEHYGVEIRRRGEQHMGFCPLPEHKGKRNSPSFSVNLKRGIFHCFGCQAKGNILDFAVLMSGQSPEDGRAVKSVAAELRAKFFPEDAKRNGRKAAEATKPDPQLEIDAVVNEPLDFELKGLDASHPYLLERGFTEKTIRHFGLGFCERGSLKGRVAIPLHDGEGNLIGYAGRVIDDASITDDNPRYRFPGKREREGKLLEFHKTEFVYNGFRIQTPVDNLVVVEGFASVWWLYQNGVPASVAIMGSEVSEEQAWIITSLVARDGCVWVLADGDKAGNKLGLVIVPRIAAERAVRWVRLLPGRQPTDLSAAEIRDYLPF